MARGILLVPKNATMLVCETCASVLHGMALDAGLPDTVVHLPCEVTGPPIDCRVCQFPIGLDMEVPQ